MTRRVAVLLVIALTPACGESPSGPTRTTKGTTSTTTTTTTTTLPGATTTTTTTTLPPLGSLRTTFGAGRHRVGTEIAAGRYFSDPPSAGCYWERQSGLGGTPAEIVANAFIDFDAAQVIVDVASFDRGFETTPECGTWFNTPRHGAQSTITPGTWLVGAQITPGTYAANARAGCYWERLRDFSGELAAIAANNFVDFPGPQLVTVLFSDIGFTTTGDCGTWTRTNAAVSPATQAPAAIAANRDRHRRR